MEKNAKIYVAGHTGMVGSAIVRQLRSDGYTNIICRTHNELDLTRQADVEKFFAYEKPEFVFLTAANVGSMTENKKFPATHLTDNTYIELNVINSALKNKCEHLLFVSSNCMYPVNAELPIKEESILSGNLDKNWEAYGLAKLLGVKYCEFCSEQYGVQYISVVPCNLYGINDCYETEKSHVVAANIKRFHLAKINHAKEVEIWGDGTALREFMFADDLAEAGIMLLNKQIDPQTINIAPGKEISIKEMAETIKNVVGYTGDCVFNTNKPGGIFRKNMNCNKIYNLGWMPRTDFQYGIKLAYEDYLRRNGSVQ